MLSSVFLFLNIGGGEMILIVFAALMLFGGEKLPGIARTLGKGIRDFKDASEDVKREINNQINTFEEKKTEIKTPATEQKTYESEGVAGTLPAFSGQSATDVIDETENNEIAVAEEEKPTEQIITESPVAEHNDVVNTSADEMLTTENNTTEEPVKKSIEEEYK
ncbi:Sec-independent protein translocase subunit TatA/TatB [Mucilaginibacter segetis]|uniref:Sec-independent protein translocase protein TatA n=1 Tax=Mucilaginibacter segetis TaxID=2793071 RepID=A0A934PUR9_9SPHI|nr:twin-arginine translocase TatA/TatE family subunit [Mucilaginibacter segetis]MBK0381214.1 twin-arginine translocase TatA/TatE family subunit [Mucilaginibacter segetis]